MKAFSTFISGVVAILQPDALPDANPKRILGNVLAARVRDST
jgi:hypothetical protein